MAVLEDRNGRRVTLAPQTLVGRGSHCEPRIEDARVSWHHAKIVWARESWWLRDLNSTNGTWLDQCRLEAEDRLPLAVGQSVAFGHGEIVWRVISVDSPRFRLRELGGKRVICPDMTMVALPSEAEPSVSIVPGQEGWLVEDAAGSTRLLLDQERIADGKRQWLVELPASTEIAAETGQGKEWLLPSCSSARLQMRVSVDRERIPIVVSVGANVYELPSRAHHELLLVLAEARVRDQQSGVASDDSGWVGAAEAARATGGETNKLNLDIFRLRREFENMALCDPHRIVERRPSYRQIRIGIRWLDIVYEDEV